MNTRNYQYKQSSSNSQASQTKRCMPLILPFRQKNAQSQIPNQNQALNLIKKPKRSKKCKSILENEHMAEIFQTVINGGDIKQVRDSDLNGLTFYARAASQKASYQKLYDEAEKCNSILESVKEEIYERQYSGNNSPKESTDNEDESSSFKKEQDMKLKKFDKETDKLIQEMLENQKREMQSFEDQWENEKPNKYRKSSAGLLQMKYIERAAVLTGNIEFAKQMQTEVEKRTIQETQDQTNLIKKDYHMMKQRLINKQINDLKRLKENRKLMKDLLELKQGKDREIYEKRNSVITNKDIENKKKKKILAIDRTQTSKYSMTQEFKYLFDPLLPPIPAPNQGNPKPKESNSSDISSSYSSKKSANNFSYKKTSIKLPSKFQIRGIISSENPKYLVHPLKPRKTFQSQPLLLKNHIFESRETNASNDNKNNQNENEDNQIYHRDAQRDSSLDTTEVKFDDENNSPSNANNNENIVPEISIQKTYEYDTHVSNDSEDDTTSQTDSSYSLSSSSSSVFETCESHKEVLYYTHDINYESNPTSSDNLSLQGNDGSFNERKENLNNEFFDFDSINNQSNDISSTTISSSDEIISFGGSRIIEDYS